MRLVYTILILSVAGCAHHESTKVDKEYRALMDELRTDFPFRAGMSVADVERLFRENNDRVHALMDEDFRKNEEKGVFLPPLYADREKHLYVFVDMFSELSTPKETSFSFWVNGRSQFWVGMAIKNKRVMNIYIAPGNREVQLPAFRFDGSGKHAGRLAESAK